MADAQKALTVRTYDGQVEMEPEGSSNAMAFDPDDAVELGYRLIELAEEAKND